MAPSRRPHRRGSYNVMLGFLLPVMIGFTALAVDTSWLRLAESQAQDVADASAHAAVIELRRTGSTVDAREAAELIIAENRVAAHAPDMGRIEFGQWDRDSGSFDPSAERPNAVKVKVGRYEANPVDLHFARIWGTDTATVRAEATAATRSVHVVVALDISTTFADSDFHQARSAIGAFLDILRDTGGADDMMGLAAFDYAYGVEYAPLFSLDDPAAVSAAAEQFAGLETVWRASGESCDEGVDDGDGDSHNDDHDSGGDDGDSDEAHRGRGRYDWSTWEAPASDTGTEHASCTGRANGRGHGGGDGEHGHVDGDDEWDPCAFDSGDPHAHMPRAYSTTKLTAPYHGLARDHSVGLQVAEEMLVEQADPFAYRAVILVTAAPPDDVTPARMIQREECEYVESRWRWVAAPSSRSEDEIIIDTHRASDEMWSDNDIHQWTVSFSSTGGSLATAVQGDGKYYQTYNAAELTPIMEEIATSLPLVIVE